MSLQSEITRLENAKTAISTAITNKGVTVPSDTKIDEYASLIDSISSSEDLDTELTEQENLISQLSTILDSKASGGSSESANIDTCTIMIETDGSLLRIGATQFINGSLTSIYLDRGTIDGETSYTIENVACGSMLVISYMTGKSVSVINATSLGALALDLDGVTTEFYAVNNS